MNKLILVIIALILFATTQAFRIKTEAQLADGEADGQPDLFEEAQQAFNDWKKQYFGTRR